MATYQSSQLEKTPLLRLKDKVGTYFVGKKIGEKPGKKPGTKIFEFAILGGDADTVEGVGKDDLNRTIYKSVPVRRGDKVVLFSDTQLYDKISQVPLNQVIRITFNGKVHNPKTGRDFNDYTVKDEEVTNGSSIGTPAAAQ